MKWRALVVALLATGLGGCVLGPDYQRPDTPVPAAWKQAPAATASLPDAWWNVFGDDELDRHVTATLAANQDLAGALARFDQSRAGLHLHRFNSSGDRLPEQRRLLDDAAQTAEEIRPQLIAAVLLKRRLQSPRLCPSKLLLHLKSITSSNRRSS